MLKRRLLLSLTGISWLLAASSAPVPPISEDELLAYASAPYDRVDQERVTLGMLNRTTVVVDFICSDFCPDYTVRVIHYELRAGQTCSSAGGVEKPVRIPVGIAATDRVFCFPKVLVDNWHEYQRKMSSVPSGVGPHERVAAQQGVATERGAARTQRLRHTPVSCSASGGKWLPPLQHPFRWAAWRSSRGEVGMKPASLIAVVVFSIVSLAHLLRLIFHVEVLVGGATVPMWVSVVGFPVAGALAIALSRESRAESSAEHAA